MNVKKKKNSCSSVSDECSELYTVHREEIFSDSTINESVLEQPFCDIILINIFLVILHYIIKKS